MITITAEQIERVNLILSGVPGGIEKALSSTIRRANNTVRSETLKGITTVYAITRQNVRAETTIKVRTQSSDGGIVGTVLFAGHKIPLYRFNVSPTIPIQRATVSAAVLAGNGRTPFQDAFIARMQSGHTGKQNRRKTECSKLVLWAVLCTYFAGFGVGVWAVVLDASQLGVFLAYVGTPTATVIGFYSWKAKAENVVKIKKANPEETEGMPVDLNNVQP